ncbi:MAG TPA: NlpC/P60 family protein [Leptospiraceae bacterium]|nr:NlpC/P60 family protein [Leptospiraceae bacterium]HRG74179.1 NlpC/P60 family protein [Leptospiraceae bacterium]
MKQFVIVFLFTFSLYAELSKAEKDNLIKTAEWLAAFDIKYSKAWTPPDSNKPVKLDCSGTVQYLYSKALSKTMPRDSYSQYNFFKEKGWLFQPPKGADNKVNTEELKKQLKFGDLIYWQDSYNVPPDRTPPVSHVMIYMGTDVTGVMRVAGSNTWGDGLITKGGGPDIYVFDPNQKIGCVREVEGDKKSKCLRDSAFIGFARFDAEKQVIEIKPKEDKNPDIVTPKENSHDPQKPDPDVELR